MLTLLQRLLAGASLLCLGTAAALAIDARVAGTQLPQTAELWSSERLQDWQRSTAIPGPRAIGALRIASVGLQAPIFPNDGDWALNRGLGVIGGYVPARLAGNLGIAGHRDGYFRALKDLNEGDRIELALDDRRQTYVVERIHVVDPDAVWVLEHVDDGALTLVTCYPFYFVGSAPQRFVVRAYPVRSATVGTTPEAHPIRNSLQPVKPVELPRRKPA